MAVKLNGADLQGIQVHKLPKDPNFSSNRLAISANPDTGKLYQVTQQQWVNLLSANNVAYKGAAKLTDNPGTPASPVFYSASEEGTYTNFKDGDGNGLEVSSSDGLVLFSYDGTSWSKQILSIDLSKFAQANNVLLNSDYVKYSENLLDNTQVSSGLYKNDGTIADSNDSIKTPLIEIDASKGSLSLSGVGGTINSFAGRFVFYTSDKTFISYSNDLINVSIPSNAGNVGVTIAFTIGIGADPTNSPYKNTMMLNYGATALPYVPYSYGIDANKIASDTLNDIISSSPAVSKANNFVDDVKYKTANLFNKTKAEAGAITSTGAAGGTSVNWLRTGFIPIEPNKLISANGYKENVSTNLAMAFYDINKNFISGIAMSGQKKYQATSPSGAAYLRGVICNDLNVGVTPTDNDYSNNFMVNYGDYKDWEPGPWKTLIDGSTIYGFNILEQTTLSDVYVSFNPTGFNGRELFVIYVKRQGEGNHYVGFQVGHAYDMDELVYQDQWRIIVANEFTFDGITMTEVDTGTLAQVESECVYMPINRTYPKADFAGGVHGDEIYSKFKFLIDGLPVTDLGTAFTLKACEKASYVQYSQIHEPPDVIDGIDTPVAGHPVECDHIKHTIFGNNGYETRNTLIWAGDKPNFWYHGICCMGKIQALNGFDEDFSEHVYTGALDQTYLKKGNKEYYYYNSTNKLSSHITSTLFADNIQDSDCQMFIWDRAGDSKYYRKTPDNAATANGEVYKSIMTIVFKQEG